MCRAAFWLVFLVAVRSDAVTVELEPAPAAVYGGTFATRALLLSNGQPHPVTGHYSVSCATFDLHSAGDVTIPAASRIRIPVRWRVPPVETIRRAVWQIRLDAGGVTHNASVEFGIYPGGLRNESFRQHSKMLAYYTFDGHDALPLVYSGLFPARIATLRDLDGIDVLILGAGTAHAAQGAAEHVRRFVENGGRVLAMPQTEALPFLPEAGAPDPQPVDTVQGVVPRAMAFRGSCDADWRQWGGAVALGGYEPSEQAGERVILCDPVGRTVAGLYAIGRGVVVVCQLDVARWFADAPPAALLFRYLVEQTLSHRPPTRTLGWIGPPDSPLLDDLETIGVAWAEVTDASPAHSFDVLIVDASPPTEIPVPILRTHMALGGDVLLLRAGPTAAGACTALCGAEVIIEDATLSPLVRGEDWELIDGIPNALLSEGVSALAVARSTSRRQHTLLVGVDDRRERCGLLAFSVGGGRLLVSTLAHDGTRNSRILLGRLLTNLNVTLR